jgi:lipid-A-disaccharide synthase
LNRPVVGLLPGSRAHEIEQILPDQLRAAAIIARRVPGVQFLLALAPTVARDQVIRQVERVEREQRAHRSSRDEDARGGHTDDTRAPVRPALITTGGALVPGDPAAAGRRDWLRRADAGAAASSANGLPLAIVEDATYDVMAASDVLITTSGTATLEAALLNKPMVIVYRLARTNLLEFLIIKKSLPAHIGMPNLLLERRACPELVQDEMTPANIAREVIALLVEPERLLRMKNDLREAAALLGEPGGARRAAQIVVDLAEQGRVQGGRDTATL